MSQQASEGDGYYDWITKNVPTDGRCPCGWHLPANAFNYADKSTFIRCPYCERLWRANTGAKGQVEYVGIV